MDRKEIDKEIEKAEQRITKLNEAFDKERFDCSGDRRRFNNRLMTDTLLETIFIDGLEKGFKIAASTGSEKKEKKQ